MTKSIQDIEGIGPIYAGKLNQQGIYTTTKLLEIAGNRAGRKKLAQQTSISEASILKWVNMSDLFRINGVAGQYAELLEGSGVDTVKELRNRNADNLSEKMKAINEEKHFCKIPPNASMITDWVEQAKTLDPLVSY